METSELYAVLEGYCPECGAEMEWTHLGGTEEFLSGWNVSEGVHIGRWNMAGDAGCLEFACCCGRTFYVEKSPWGDWSGSECREV